MFRRKMLFMTLLALLFLLTACGKKPASTIDVSTFDYIHSGTIFSFTEDKLFYPTDEETDTVVKLLVEDLSLAQEQRGSPQGIPIFTFILDNIDDNQQLQIAVIEGRDELLLTYTADTNNAADKAYFHLQSTALREYMETLYEEILADPFRW